MTGSIGPRLATYSTGSMLPKGDVFDVVVVGGGMVGATFASLLAANPLTAALRVLLLDRAPPPEAPSTLPPVPGLRVSTLTPASMRLIEKAGAWRDVAPPHSAAFDTMQARALVMPATSIHCMQAPCPCSMALGHMITHFAPATAGVGQQRQGLRALQRVCSWRDHDEPRGRERRAAGCPAAPAAPAWSLHRASLAGTPSAHLSPKIRVNWLAEFVRRVSVPCASTATGLSCAGVPGSL